ncbi:IgGFc-binding protein-like [Mytilus edulis]|uniref:IgGFc-binding protein-like n=1 Tax=Mytilus edulis TaxID=6550 RepID=UPI0039EFEB77
MNLTVCVKCVCDLKLILLIYFSAYLCMVQFTSAVLDNRGKEFLVAFMENEVYHGNDINPEIYVTTSKKTIVNVNVSASGNPNAQLYKTFSVIYGQTQLVKLNTSLRLNHTELTKKAVLIEADDEIVVYVVNREEMSDDVYLAMPIDALGKEYYTVSYSPATHYCLFAVIGVYDETNVSIHLPHIHHLSVSLNGHTYHGNQWMNVTLDRLSTLQVRSKHDLTGSHIVSSKPIAVLSGNKKTAVGHGDSRDHLVEMLLPLSSWGSNFATVPIPDRHGKGDMFRIIASEDNTHVHVSGINSGKPFRDNIKLDKAGQHVQKHYSSGLYSHIVADKAISVFQFSLTQIGHGDHADPSMITVVPIEQYAFEYTFTTPEYSHGNYSNYFMFIIDSSQTSGLRIDNRSLAGNQIFHKIPETHLVGGYVEISVGTHTVMHTDPTTVFGGILFGKAVHESYGFPVGLLSKPINTDCLVSQMIEGDKIDNDCDGEIDEEQSDGKDNDGDGQIDEDCICCPFSGPKLPDIFGRR